ncbi:hypothetical protein VTJ83DRAFT_6599 [Remersonia thermophila]|uniref:HSF-type DNA-binding domain-containing protein n=1 Tax=Remersonia thermophila TaxID=72144 RepID=A0ABR4D7D4_9PEZI
MSSPNPRKRPVPGNTPMVPVPQMSQAFSPVQSDPMFRWNAVDGAGFIDPAAPAVNSFSMMPTAGTYPQGIATPSTALARRQNSRALVPTAPRAPFERTADTLNGFGDDAGYLHTGTSDLDEHDNIERLEELAQRAKREAQAKRKQIPPFVQKLSSFLDESRNTDLIRWSDKGDSFIVLDEDEFAKTLIPELFKHNNYASFVRQLNMYGFHKRVGLSDNSMKASERKNKSPSEYYNPYFRRGHPNLLWLINKPKSGSSKKKAKKEEVENESEEDGVEETYSGGALATSQAGRPVSNEIAPLQKKDLLHVKQQIERLQQQQVAISNMLNKLRQDQNQLYQQAVLFQTMHERHENSINAILNFLANVFRKSLEEQGGAQTVQDLLASIIPNAQGHAQTQMPQPGGVVDLGGFVNQRPQSMTAVGTPKRPQRLLPPIPVHQPARTASVSTATTMPPTPKVSQTPRMGTVTELFDASPGDTTTPAYVKNELRNNPQEGMMKIIQDTNAVNSAPAFDLPEVAAKTPASMSDDQRAQMLNIMARSSNASVPATAATVAVPSPAVSVPAVPSTPVNPNIASLSLSSGLSPIPTMPFTQEIQNTEAQLEALQRLQSDQAEQIDALTQMLGPLSPSGRIPGLDEHGNPNTNYFDSVDFNEFVNPTAFGDQNFDAGDLDGIGAADGSDFNFSLDGPSTTTTTAAGDFIPSVGTTAGQPTTAVTSTTTTAGATNVASAVAADAAAGSPKSTPSPAVTEEIDRPDFGESPERGTKRRRRA